MDRGLAVIVTAVAGGFIALQPPLNAVLGRATEGIAAAFISSLIGTLALAAILALSGGPPASGGRPRSKWYYLIGGGLLGAMYVYVRSSPCRRSEPAEWWRRRSPASW